MRHLPATHTACLIPNATLSFPLHSRSLNLGFEKAKKKGKCKQVGGGEGRIPAGTGRGGGLSPFFRQHVSILFLSVPLGLTPGSGWRRGLIQTAGWV